METLIEYEANPRPIVFKDEDHQWTVLMFRPFSAPRFDTWAEAYSHAYWSARIGNVLDDVFAGGDCA